MNPLARFALPALLIVGAAAAEPVVLSPSGHPYVGDPISIDVKDGDVTDLLRLFADVGRLNLVVDPAVKGRTITLRLDDVPWDQALDLVLRTQGLASDLSGNVLRVAPSSKLAAEGREEAALREAREASGELRTIAYPLSWGNASQVEAIVRKGLTPRGSTMIDRRTNTLFVTDVFPAVEGLGDLIVLEPMTAQPTYGVELRLFDVEGPLPASLTADALAAHPGTRLVDARRVELALEQDADVTLGGSTHVVVSPQRDGSRTVLSLRAQSGDGRTVARAVATDASDAVVLAPATPSRTLGLAVVGA